MIQKAKKKTRKLYGWDISWSIASAGDIDVPNELDATVFHTFVDLADCSNRDNAVLEASLTSIGPILKRLGVDASCVEVLSVRSLYSSKGQGS